MNNKTRKLQLFMRALSATELEGDRARKVELGTPRIDARRRPGSSSAPRRPASLPPLAED